MSKQNQSGFGTIEILLVLVIVVLIGVIGYMVYENHYKITSTTVPIKSNSFNTEDEKVIADLKTIDDGITSYSNSNNNSFTNTGSCGAVTIPVTEMGIKGLNYPLNNYKITDLATGDDQCGDIGYNICTNFNSSTWSTDKTTEVESQGDFSNHDKGAWCFIVYDVQEPDGNPSSVTSVSEANLSKQPLALPLKDN